MSSHFLSSQYGGSHYASNHFGRVEIAVEDISGAGSGHDDTRLRNPLDRRRKQDDEDLIVIMAAITQIFD